MTKPKAKAKVKQTIKEAYGPYVQLGDLYGPEGNAFVIMGRCRKALTVAGVPERETGLWTARARSGDYASLLELVLETFHLGYPQIRQCQKLIRTHRLGRTREGTARREDGVE